MCFSVVRRALLVSSCAFFVELGSFPRASAVDFSIATAAGCEFAISINSIGHKLTGYRTAYDDERGFSCSGTSDCDVECFYTGE